MTLSRLLILDWTFFIMIESFNGDLFLPIVYSIQFHQEATQTLSSLLLKISSENKRSEIKYLRRSTNRLFLLLRAVVANEIWNSWIYPFQAISHLSHSPNCMTFPFRNVIFHDFLTNMQTLFLYCFHHCHNAFRHRNRSDFSQFYLPQLIQPYQKTIKLKMCSQPFLLHRANPPAAPLTRFIRKERCFSYLEAIFITLSHSALEMKLLEQRLNWKKLEDFC